MYDICIYTHIKYIYNHRHTYAYAVYYILYVYVYSHRISDIQHSGSPRYTSPWSVKWEVFGVEPNRMVMLMWKMQGTT